MELAIRETKASCDGLVDRVRWVAGVGSMVSSCAGPRWSRRGVEDPLVVQLSDPAAEAVGQKSNPCADEWRGDGWHAARVGGGRAT